MSEQPERIGAVPFLKTMWALFWTAFLHPFTNTAIDMRTGSIMSEHPQIERRGNVEVRLNDDGTVDEIVIWDSDGSVSFHMEQMDDGLYWMAAEIPDGRLVCNLWAKKKRIKATHEWETDGRDAEK